MHFNIRIQAPAEKVWDTLWSDNTYRQWNGVLAEGSHAVSDWKEGSPIYFMDRSGNGVYSIIDKKIPNKLMSIVNLCELFEGCRQVVDERTSAMEWTGATENYWLNEKDGHTALWVEMEVNKADAALFAEKFPKALEKLKELAETGIAESVPADAEVYGFRLAV